MLTNGFHINNANKCVYIKKFENSYVILCLYVDDILIFGDDINAIMNTKSLLSNNFDMKDLGVVDVILGIKLLKNNNGFILSQSHYIEKLLNKLNYSNVTLVAIYQNKEK